MTRPDAVPVILLNYEQMIILLVESGIGDNQHSHDLINIDNITGMSMGA